MTQNEIELIRLIRESADPAKTLVMAADIMQRLINGDDIQSIAASYGLIMTATGNFVKA